MFQTGLLLLLFFCLFQISKVEIRWTVASESRLQHLRSGSSWVSHQASPYSRSLPVRCGSSSLPSRSTTAFSEREYGMMVHILSWLLRLHPFQSNTRQLLAFRGGIINAWSSRRDCCLDIIGCHWKMSSDSLKFCNLEHYFYAELSEVTVIVP